MKSNGDIYRAILQTLPDIVYEIDGEGRFTYINDAVEKLGYRRDELIGRHFSVIVHPDDLEFVERATVLKRMKGKVTGDEEAPRLFDERRGGKRLTRKLTLHLLPANEKDSEPVPGEVVSIGIYNFDLNDNRVFIGTLGVIRDITEKKKTEEALLHQERHYRVLLENSSDLISIVANDGTILFESDSIKRILGLDPVDIIGESLYDYLSDESISSVRTFIEGKGGSEEKSRELELFMYNHRREQRCMETVLSRITSDTDSGICFILNSIDITERKIAEDLIRESGEKFRAILEHSMEVILLADPDWDIQFLSQSIEDFTGYSPYELVGRNINALVSEEDVQVLKENTRAAIEEGVDHLITEFSIFRKNNTSCEIEACISNCIERQPINGFIFHMKDISDVREADRALKNSEEKYRNLYNTALVSMITIEEKGGMILACNDLGHALFGYQDRSEFIGENFYATFYSDRDLAGFIEEMKTVGKIERREIILVKKNGDRMWVAVTAKYNEDEGIIDLVLLDVTNIKDTEDQLFRLTFFDSLTELPNKDLFSNRITVETLKGQQFAIMCMGMDNFKNINEMYGTDFGDKVLQKIASDLNDEYFRKDLVCRFAEDKFMVLLSDIGTIRNEADVDTIDTIAHKTRMIFSRPFLVNRVNVEVLPSIGISIFPADGKSPEELVKNAESAMYVAKSNGGNTFHYYDAELNREMMHRLEIEKDLKEAIKKREFIPYFQSKVDAEGHLVGMESLIRWKINDSGRLVCPDDFIFIAEKNRTIVDIGLMILEESCQRNRLWQEEGFEPVRVAVNLSPFQFKQDDLIEQIKKRIERSNLDPRWLELEITESGIMENEEDSIRKLSELHAMGISLSIDDFGTGYSSLSKLKSYPIDTLKIDKSFVEDIPGDVPSVTLVNTIIDLAHNLGFKVVAEGVESEEQFNFLRAVGCDFFQGYYFSPPRPPEEFVLFLTKKEK